MEEFDWAQRFADILEHNIAYLPIGEFQKANELLALYRKGITPLQGKVSLRELIEAAASYANAEGKDPASEILKAIASRAKDVEAHYSEDRTVYEDIKSWLEHEASIDKEDDQ